MMEKADDLERQSLKNLDRLKKALAEVCNKGKIPRYVAVDVLGKAAAEHIEFMRISREREVESTF